MPGMSVIMLPPSLAVIVHSEGCAKEVGTEFAGKAVRSASELGRIR